VPGPRPGRIVGAAGTHAERPLGSRPEGAFVTRGAEAQSTTTLPETPVVPEGAEPSPIVFPPGAPNPPEPMVKLDRLNKGALPEALTTP